MHEKTQMPLIEVVNARVIFTIARFLAVVMSVCLSVHLSVCHKSVFYSNG